MTPDDDIRAMATEYQAQLDRLDDPPTDEQLAATMEWNRTHNWRAYFLAHRMITWLDQDETP